MTKHYLKISDNGKNLQLSITNSVVGVAITKLLIKKANETDYKDISDEILNSETFLDSSGLTRYVFDILLESIGYENGFNMFYLYIEDAYTNNYQDAVAYLAPVYYAMFNILTSYETIIKMNDFIYITRLHHCLQAFKMAIELERLSEAEYLYNQIEVLLSQTNTRFLELDNYPLSGE
jgi:hypothetical protein